MPSDVNLEKVAEEVGVGDPPTEVGVREPVLALVQNRYTARFKEPHAEEAYQVWHGENRIHLLRLLLLIASCIALISSSIALSTLSAQDSMKGELVVAYPDKAWILVLTGVCSRLIGLLAGLALFSRQMRQALTSQRLVQVYATSVFAVCFILEYLPVTLLASWSSQQHLRWPLTSAPPPPEDEGRSDAFTDPMTAASQGARSAYFEASTIDFYGALIGGLSGIRPEYALPLALLLCLLAHMQFQAVFANALIREGAPEPANVVPYHMRAFPFFATLLLAISMDRSGRQEFRAKKQLQQSTAEHIEQLKREKERLGWDIRLERSSDAGSAGAAASPRLTARRRVEIQLGPTDADAALGASGRSSTSLSAAGILREPRVYASTCSSGGDSASTSSEIMGILPPNAALGANMPRSLSPAAIPTHPPKTVCDTV